VTSRGRKLRLPLGTFGKMTTDDGDAIGSGAVDGMLVDIHANDVRLWRLGHQPAHHCPASGAQIHRPACAEHPGGLDDEVFCLWAGDVHTTIDGQRPATELDPARDPRQRLPLFSPSDPRFELVVV
jgi:hypothetical protein